MPGRADLPQELLPEVLQHIGNGITVLGPDGRFLFANAEAAQQLGFESAEALLRADASAVMARYQLLDAEGRPLGWEQLPNALAREGKSSGWTVVGFRLRGTHQERWALMKSTPVLDGAQVRFTINVFHDITAQRREEMAAHFLARASSRLASAATDYRATLSEVAHLAVPSFADWCAVDLAEDRGIKRVAVAHVDPEKVKFAFELEARYPTPMDETNGVLRVIRGGASELYPELPMEMLEAAAVDAEHRRLIHALQLRSAIVVPLQAHGERLGAITFVWAESGRSYGQGDLALAEDLGRRAGMAVANARLFEEVKRLSESLERRVAERTAELEEANRELESFSYSVSHDLRAPLRHVSGFAELLDQHARGQLDERGLHYLQTLRDAATRAGELVDALLDFSRLGRATLHPAPVDLNALVAQVRAELEPELAGRKVTFAVGELPNVPGDAALLRLVFENLLGNAVKFTARTPDARIEIFAQQQDAEFVFTVRDNGAGFDPRYSDKLFGVFQRLHGSEFEGTGIGLATVKRIVARHGGRIWAEAEPGRGAAFHFTLAAPEPAP